MQAGLKVFLYTIWNFEHNKNCVLLHLTYDCLIIERFFLGKPSFRRCQIRFEIYVNLSLATKRFATSQLDSKIWITNTSRTWRRFECVDREEQAILRFNALTKFLCHSERFHWHKLMLHYLHVTRKNIGSGLKSAGYLTCSLYNSFDFQWRYTGLTYRLHSYTAISNKWVWFEQMALYRHRMITINRQCAVQLQIENYFGADKRMT